MDDLQLKAADPLDPTFTRQEWLGTTVRDNDDSDDWYDVDDDYNDDHQRIGGDGGGVFQEAKPSILYGKIHDTSSRNRQTQQRSAQGGGARMRARTSRRRAEADGDGGRQRGGQGPNNNAAIGHGAGHGVRGKLGAGTRRSHGEIDSRRPYSLHLIQQRPRQIPAWRRSKWGSAIQLRHAQKPRNANAAIARSFGTSREFEPEGTPRYARRDPSLVTRHWRSPQSLVGLKYGLHMDPQCPNVALHCKGDDCKDHSKRGHTSSLDLVKSDMQSMVRFWQIKRTMEPMVGCDGTTAQLFRFLHIGLGYAFAAKGMPLGLRHLPEHEGGIYERI